MAGGTSTIFYDSNSPTTVRKYVPSTTLEYASYSEYFADYNDVLKRQRGLVPAGYLMPNHAQNFSRAEELAVTRDVTGGVMIEYENTPYGSGVKEWNAIDGLVARFGLAGESVGEVVAGAVLKHARDFNLTREAVLGSKLAA